MKADPILTHEAKDMNGKWHRVTGMQAAALMGDGYETRKIEEKETALPALEAKANRKTWEAKE